MLGSSCASRVLTVMPSSSAAAVKASTVALRMGCAPCGVEMPTTKESSELPEPEADPLGADPLEADPPEADPPEADPPESDPPHAVSTKKAPMVRDRVAARRRDVSDMNSSR